MITTALDAGVATITLASPRNRNALSRQLMVELAEALAATANDPAVRVVVLTGADPAFCAGMDLAETRDGQGPGPIGLADLLMAIWEHPKPVVARVNGAARAGGVGLFAACDVAIGLADATFAFSEVRIGVVPAMIAVPVLMRMAPADAHELMLTGEPFSGVRAAACGLLNRAVPAADLDTAVGACTVMLLRGGPGALQATKQLRRTLAGRPPAEALAAMAALSADHFTGVEGREGIAAQRAKRDPAWMTDRG